LRFPLAQSRRHRRTIPIWAKTAQIRIDQTESLVDQGISIACIKKQGTYRSWDACIVPSTKIATQDGLKSYRNTVNREHFGTFSILYAAQTGIWVILTHVQLWK
jgi:hypothetical protein